MIKLLKNVNAIVKIMNQPAGATRHCQIIIFK